MASMRTASLVLFLSTIILTSVAHADYSQHLEKLKSALASATKPHEVERLKKEIAHFEELDRQERLTSKELLAEAEAMHCSPNDGNCVRKKSNMIYRAKSKISSEELELSRKREYQQREKDRIEAEARQKVHAEQEYQEQKQKDIEQEQMQKAQEKRDAEREAAHDKADKAMSDYIASRMKEFAHDKTLIAIKPGAKLCAFPDSGNGYLFVEDVDKNKIHAVKEYGHPLRPTHKVVVRKHPKFDGKLELEFIGHGLGMFLLEDFKRVRLATERCPF